MKKIPINIMRKGFVALITSVMLSAALMAIALAGSERIGSLFDMTERKEYRLDALQATLFCLDHVYVELAHDYFYTITNPVSFNDKKCSIVSVVAISSSTLAAFPFGSLKSIIIIGSAADSRYHITATLQLQVLLDNNKISLLSQTASF